MACWSSEGGAPKHQEVAKTKSADAIFPKISEHGAREGNSKAKEKQQEPDQLEDLVTIVEENIEERVLENEETTIVEVAVGKEKPPAKPKYTQAEAATFVGLIVLAVSLSYLVWRFRSAWLSLLFPQPDVPEGVLLPVASELKFIEGEQPTAPGKSVQFDYEDYASTISVDKGYSPDEFMGADIQPGSLSLGSVTVSTVGSAIASPENHAADWNSLPENEQLAGLKYRVADLEGRLEQTATHMNRSENLLRESNQRVLDLEAELEKANEENRKLRKSSSKFSSSLRVLEKAHRENELEKRKLDQKVKKLVQHVSHIKLKLAESDKLNQAAR